MKFFRLIREDKTIRSAFLLLVITILFLSGSYIFGFMRYYAIEFEDTHQSKVDVVVPFLENISDKAEAYSSHFSELGDSIDNDEFLGFTESLFGDYEIVEKVLISPSGTTEYVYPESDATEYLNHDMLEEFTIEEFSLFTNSLFSKESFVTYSIDGEYLVFHNIIYDDDGSFLSLVSVFISTTEFVNYLPYHFESEDFVFFSDTGVFLIGNENYDLSSYRFEEVTINGIMFHVGSNYQGSYFFRTQTLIFTITFMSILPILTIFAIFYYDRNIQMKLEDELEYTSKHSFLTGIKNNISFYEDVDRLIAEKDEFFMALGVFNNIKYINDKYGHVMGDKLITEGINLIQGVLRSHTELYHYGGDEYIIIFKSSSKSEVSNILRRILKIFDRDIVIDRIRTNISMTIGVVNYPTQGRNPDELIKNAHITQSSKKVANRNMFEFYNQQLFGSHEVDQDFDKYVDGLNLELFEVYLMPIINVESNKIVGFECLTRAFNDFDESMDTELIVNSLERSGRIQELDEIVFSKMLLLMRKLNNDFPEEEFFLSVNASALSFNEKYVDYVIDLFEHERFTKGTIVLELTESYKVEDYDYLIRLFNRLNEKGIKTAIDDFGSGYSSLSYISKFPIYAIKVDKSYVRDYYVNSFNRTLFLTLRSIADVLECKLVAEGVDDPETLSFLKENNCELYQGFLFSKGVPFEKAVKMIKKNIKDTKNSS